MSEPQTISLCPCGEPLQLKYARPYGGIGVACNVCERQIPQDDMFYHCVKRQNTVHPTGYDICLKCSVQLRIQDLQVS